MSGHSKWAQIKHKKAIADAKKGKVFGKLAKAIAVAARGNPDPATNLRLKGEIDRARAANMPSDNIERAIRRVSDKDSPDLSEILLEILGPGNAGLLVSAITDNSNRTIGEIKQIIQKNGGRLAGQGSVSWMFAKSGVIRLPAGPDAESIQLEAIDKGADDVRTDDGMIVILTRPEKLETVRSALGRHDAEAALEFVPTTLVPLPDPKDQQALEGLFSALDEHDDVQDVFTNADY